MEKTLCMEEVCWMGGQPTNSFLIKISQQNAIIYGLSIIFAA
jgi:hypothetical protein